MIQPNTFFIIPKHIIFDIPTMLSGAFQVKDFKPCDSFYQLQSWVYETHEFFKLSFQGHWWLEALWIFSF